MTSTGSWHIRPCVVAVGAALAAAIAACAPAMPARPPINQSAALPARSARTRPPPEEVQLPIPVAEPELVLSATPPPHVESEPLFEWRPLNSIEAPDDGACSQERPCRIHLDEFASSVAVEDGTALAGEFLAARAYFWNSNTQGFGEPAMKKGQRKSYFGARVALSQNTAMIAAFGERIAGRSDHGTVHVLRREKQGWTELQSLIPRSRIPGTQFGVSVVLEGETAFVGSHGLVGTKSSAGVVHVFGLRSGAWTEVQELAASHPADDALFGTEVAVSGGTALISASGETEPPEQGHGSVYVYSESGGRWTESARLRNLSGASHDYFGEAVAIDGDTALCSAAGLDGMRERRSVVHVFERRDGQWVRAQVIEPDGALHQENFGAALAIKGDLLLIGAPSSEKGSGAVFAFVRTQDGWKLQKEFAPGDRASRFGGSLAFDGTLLLMGVPPDDHLPFGRIEVRRVNRLTR